MTSQFMQTFRTKKDSAWHHSGECRSSFIHIVLTGYPLTLISQKTIGAISTGTWLYVRFKAQGTVFLSLSQSKQLYSISEGFISHHTTVLSRYFFLSGINWTVLLLVRGTLNSLKPVISAIDSFMLIIAILDCYMLIIFPFDCYIPVKSPLDSYILVKIPTIQLHPN